MMIRNEEKLMTKLQLPLGGDRLSEWIARFPKPSPAEFCVRYALAFNTLKSDWLSGVLAPFVTYGSQSVFETLKGKKQVWDYIAGKIETLSLQADSQPRAELATDFNGNPCVLMYQPKGNYDRTWLNTPLASVEIKVDDQELASEIFMITTVPAPATTERSGIYPGVHDTVHERAKRFIRPQADYRGLQFSYFLLDGKMRLDLKMVEAAAKVQPAFPGATSSTMITSERTSARDELDEVGFIGFPAVAVYWQGETIYRHEGLVFADSLIAAIKQMTQMHVVYNP